MSKSCCVRRSISFLASLVLVLCASTVVWACPNCRDALADSPQGQGLATGFYYSILFMMSMPFIVLGTLVSVAYRSVQRAKSAQDAESLPEA